MTQSLERLTGALIEAATKAGAEAADAIAVDGTSLSIDVRGGTLEQAERAEGVDLGLRVIIGQRQACVSASDTADQTIAEMAERAVAMAREAPEDPTVGLAQAAQLSTRRDADGLELADDAPEPAAAALEASAREAEAAAMAIEGVTQVSSTSAGYSRHNIHLAATNGFSGGYTRTSHGLSCVAISGEGTDMQRDYAGESRAMAADMPSAAATGTLAGTRAAEIAGAKQPPTGAYPVLFDERISSSLIAHLASAVNGSAIARGASWLRDALDQAVLPDHLSLEEIPHQPRLAGSRYFDAEGLPTANRKLVDNGVLTGWVLDLATARKLDLQSTANAQRGTSSPPSPGLTNLRLTQGEVTREDLLAQMGTGLLVTSMIGSTINPNTGDYSRGASGFWVENGQITYPVNECTIAGNLRPMLRSIIPANDARLHLSRQVPSLLVEGLTLAGA
ncbi:modulator protein [Actibacterium mucosum KCTC 23349]|uniref:Modulator protein n=1 Tax=Actibacterium mucosum KCTC 23349 TaxID=1454373 RepID=A0A037ZN03_9RHOB|nr:metallopeptidase TldD-related protein [Actibacterium mucosum]KAJ57454.1 modulator protein [Actibacterium mucosum KCTC 23349]